MCLHHGPPKPNSQEAIQTQANTAYTAEQDRRNKALAPLMPYATDQMNNGLGGDFNSIRDQTSAQGSQAAGTSRNAILRNFAASGVDANDPSVLQTMNDFESSRSRGADDRLMQLILANRQAKQQGAQLLAGIASGSNPQGYLNTNAQLALA